MYCHWVFCGRSLPSESAVSQIQPHWGGTSLQSSKMTAGVIAKTCHIYFMLWWFVFQAFILEGHSLKKTPNATVIHCQIICLQCIEPYKLLVSQGDSQASNYNLLRKESTHCHSLCKHKGAYIFHSQWHKGPFRFSRASTLESRHSLIVLL